MSIVKVLEVIAESHKSFDDAAQQAVKQASATVREINNTWIDNFSGVVEGDRIVRYRVNAKHLSKAINSTGFRLVPQNPWRLESG